MKNKILHLTLKKKWFDMILSGEKKEEYREIKDYWIKRIQVDKTKCYFDFIKFRNGYSKNAFEFLIELKKIRVGKPLKEWSDDSFDKKVFILELGEIIT